MRARTWAPLAVALLLLAGLRWWRTREPPPSKTLRQRPGVALTAAPRGSEAATIEGRVRNALGGWVGGATVAALLAERQERLSVPGPVALATTGADGRFRITLPDGIYRITAAAAGFAPEVRHGVVALVGQTTSVELSLLPGEHTLSGRVLDRGGGPIGGATVRAGVGAAVLAVVEAASDGTYHLTLLRGSHELTVEADGYAPARAWLELVGDTTRDFRLNPASSIAGTVVRRSDHAPVPQAWVLAGAAEAECDEHGAFVLRNLNPGDYRVHAGAGPLAGRTMTPVAVPPATAVTGVVLELGPGYAVSGHVKRQGAAVTGAAVLLVGDEGALRREALSGAGGAFRFEGVLPGPYSALLASWQKRETPARDVFVVEADVSGVELEAPSIAVVRGRVVDEANQPVAGASVWVSSAQRPNDPHTAGPARSDGEGRFRIEDVLPAPLVKVGADHQTKGRAMVVIGAVASGEEREVTIQLSTSGVRIRGRVSYQDGSPAPGLMISGTGWGGRAGLSETTTESDGSYELGPFPLGAGVYVSVEEAAGWAGADDSLDRGKGVRIDREQDIHLDFVLRRSNLSIRGVVRGPDGQPLAGATVATRPGREGAGELTGEDGRFSVEGLLPGSYAVTGEHPGLPRAMVRDVAAGADNVVVQLQAGAVLAGVVEAEGRPAAPYTIWARPARTPGEGEGAHARQWVGAPDGAFELRGLAAGKYDLLAATLDGRSASLPGIALAAGEARRGLRLAVGAGVALAGKVVEIESRRPLPGVQARARGEAGTAVATTDADGAFRLDGLLPGAPAELQLDAAGFVSHRRTVRPPVGREVFDLGAIPLLPEKPLEPVVGRVGLVLTMNDDGGIAVRTAVDALPASKAGIRAGDLILAVDLIDVKNADLGTVVTMVGGRPGTPVTIDVRSPGGPVRHLRVVRM